VEVDAGVAVRLALEAQRELKIAVALLRRQIAVLLGDAFAEYLAVLHDPTLFAYLGPAGEVFAVEELNPLRADSMGPHRLSACNGYGKGEGKGEQRQLRHGPMLSVETCGGKRQFA
jgi:hypothetical protein